MYIKRTNAILHYEEQIRENVRQRERMKKEITQMENEQTKGRFWKEKHRMLNAGELSNGICKALSGDNDYSWFIR